jgi:hypothetical protein
MKDQSDPINLAYKVLFDLLAARRNSYGQSFQTTSELSLLPCVLILSISYDAVEWTLSFARSYTPIQSHEKSDWQYSFKCGVK